MRKEAQAVNVIGGADGPTAIFFAGTGSKEKNIIRRLRNTYRQWRYGRNRKKAIKKIKAEAHSVQETIEYMKLQYGAVEKNCDYTIYKERRLQMKFSIIQREKPELIGADKRILPPKDINSQDQEITMRWLRDLEMWNDQCLERTKKVTEDIFPINYHLYVIDCGADGEIEIEMEETRGIMGMSCSGDIKKLHSRIRDIYIYYGVSQEDINNSTNRYKTLIAELSNS